MPTPMLLNGDTLHLPLANQSVHMIVTSPPYYMLRDYIAANQLGQEPIYDCNSWAMKDRLQRYFKSSGQAWGSFMHNDQVQLLQRLSDPCDRCFICKMRKAFAEAWRVLRDDGTLWINIGDTAASRGGRRKNSSIFHKREGIEINQHREPQIAKKQWYGIPWRLALALQADGWLWRMDIAWEKSNGLPEPVKDRPVRSHEYIWLFSKQRKYYYDWFAVQEMAKSDLGTEGELRRQRSIWRMPVSAYGGDHFATFPPALAEAAIKAGASAHGVCAKCNEPYQRYTRKKETVALPANPNPITASKDPASTNGTGTTTLHGLSRYESLGWFTNCTCDAGVKPATVLDLFNGSGTTLEVANQLGHQGLGVDISYEYLVTEAKQRLGLNALEEFYKGIQGGDADIDFGLFANL